MDLSYPHGKEGSGFGNVAYREYGVEWGDECLKQAFQYTIWWQRPYLVVCRWAGQWFFFCVCFCFLHSRNQENSRSYYNFIDYIWQIVGICSAYASPYYKVLKHILCNFCKLKTSPRSTVIPLSADFYFGAAESTERIFKKLLEQ